MGIGINSLSLILSVVIYYIYRESYLRGLKEGRIVLNMEFRFDYKPIPIYDLSDIGCKISDAYMVSE